MLAQVVVGPHVYPPSISGGYGDRTAVRWVTSNHACTHESAYFWGEEIQGVLAVN